MKFWQILGGLLLPCIIQGQNNAPCYTSNCGGYTDITVPVPVPVCQSCATTTTVDRTELKCEPGYILVNNVCERSERIMCPTGTRQVGNTCVREYREDVKCPIGSELRNGICVRVFDPVCSYGYRMLNGECVREEIVPIECPPGSFLKNNECVRVTCPSGHILQNGWCIRKETPRITDSCTYNCPTGYIYENGVCMPTIQPPPTVIPPPTVTCPQPPPPVPRVIVEPPPIQTCSNGYTLRGNQCQTEVVTCPEGYVQRSDKCEKISCPTASTWNGERCSQIYVQGSNTTNLVNNTHIVHNFNNVSHDTNVNVNNVNNVYIYKGGEVVHVSNGTQPPIVIERTERPDTELVDLKSERCCDVVTPRLCKNVNSKWRCYNRKYHRCGSFCTQPKIQLRPLQPIYREQTLVMPPGPVVHSGSCGPAGCSEGQLNCSGCTSSGDCSPSCYRYSCESNNCNYQDQQSFCQEYAGPGCGQEDGCYY